MFGREEDDGENNLNNKGKLYAKKKCNLSFYPDKNYVYRDDSMNCRFSSIQIFFS